MKQMESLEEYPDIVVGCTGGGSNFSGIALPYLGDAINNDKKINLIAIEPSACPSLTKGKYAYDFGDTGMMTPLTKMHTLGSQFVPSGFLLMTPIDAETISSMLSPLKSAAIVLYAKCFC